MITDIFARRYLAVQLRGQYSEEDRRLVNQVAVMVMDPLWLGMKADLPSETTEKNLKEIHDVLALELGRDFLSARWWFQSVTFNGNNSQVAQTNSYASICKTFLTEMPSDMNMGDSWMKERISFIELSFQRRLAQVEEINRNLPIALARAAASDSGQSHVRVLKVPGLQVDAVRAFNKSINSNFAEITRDLNDRLRLARYKLAFNNGLIQLVEDEQINKQVATPFWSLIASATWANVDAQIKEAIDRRDNRDRTAAFHAVCALESCIKIISDVKGWTHGKEGGAANFIDNLGSKKNGNFVELWEAEMLKSMFSDVRNPFAHGPGQAAMPSLSKEQTEWAIDTAMTWINSLIRRM